MALELWLIAIIFMVGIALIFKLVKKVFKAFGFIIILFIIMNLALGFLVYMDVTNLKKNFFSQPSVYILHKDNVVRAAVSFSFPQGGGEPQFNLAKTDDLKAYSESLQQGNMDGLKGLNYKIFRFEILSLL